MPLYPPPPSGGGGSIDVEENGTPVVTTATAINFKDAEVTDAGSGQANVTTPAGQRSWWGA